MRIGEYLVVRIKGKLCCAVEVGSIPRNLLTSDELAKLCDVTSDVIRKTFEANYVQVYSMGYKSIKRKYYDMFNLRESNNAQ